MRIEPVEALDFGQIVRGLEQGAEPGFVGNHVFRRDSIAWHDQFPLV